MQILHKKESRWLTTWAHSAALISIYVASSQTPTYTVKPQIWHNVKNDATMENTANVTEQQDA